MSEWLTGENRIRLFLGFLILVLIVVNSQSLQLSYQSRNQLVQVLEDTVRSQSERIAFAITPLFESGNDTHVLSSMTVRLEELSRQWDVRSLCLLDWDGKLLGGSETCRLSGALDFDRLDREGRKRLVENRWAVTGVTPSYDLLAAVVYAYRVLRIRESSNEAVLRVEIPAPHLALANRNLRSSLIYQISAMALVLLSLVFFLNSLLAPHRRLMAEARSVAGGVASGDEPQDENQFLLSTFQGVVAQLKEKEQQLEGMHLREKNRADETQALATDIIRSMTTGLVSLDGSGRVALVNPAAGKIFRLDGSDVEGKAFFEAFPGSRELSEWIDLAIEEGQSTLRRQVEYIHADGRSTYLGVSVIPLAASDGAVRGALCLHADLTEVIQLRERLYVKENLERLGEMSAGIAHELRNGLATILGNTRLLQQAVSSEKETELVHAVVEEGNALNRVVTEFLQFARPDRLRPVSADIEALVEELTEELQGRAVDGGVQLILRADSCRAEVDEVLVRQAVQNLILNGIEAAGTKEGGEVEIRVEQREGCAVIRVRDNGPGIPESDRPRVFAPFFTTKPEGTGLGLALVQKIVVAHNGEVTVEPHEDGTVFSIKIPNESEDSASIEEWV